jgi:hypothetical protein
MRIGSGLEKKRYCVRRVFCGEPEVHFAGKRYVGAARGIRTPDPRFTKAVLYRLSYCGSGATDIGRTGQWQGDRRAGGCASERRSMFRHPEVAERSKALEG